MSTRRTLMVSLLTSTALTLSSVSGQLSAPAIAQTNDTAVDYAVDSLPASTLSSLMLKGLHVRPPGVLSYRSVTIDQDRTQREAIAYLRELRARAWDDPATRFNGKDLREHARSQGITTKDQYVAAIQWDPALESSAVQRAVETGLNFSHQRPTGEGIYDAPVSPLAKTAAENLGQAGARSFDFEYDILKRDNGNRNSNNGHIHSLLNPEYRTFAAGDVRGEGNTRSYYTWLGGRGATPGAATLETGQRSGTYLAAVTVPESYVPALVIPASMTVGQKATVKAVATLPAGTTTVAGTLSSSNSDVVRADSPTLTALTSGTATISFAPAVVTSTGIALGTPKTSRVTVTGGVTTPADPETPETPQNPTPSLPGGSSGAAGVAMAAIVALMALLAGVGIALPQLQSILKF